MSSNDLSTTELLQQLLQEIASVKENMVTKEDLKESELKTQHYMNVLAEQIIHDLAGAHTDQVSTLKDKVEDHEPRITTLEVFAGIRSH